MKKFIFFRNDRLGDFLILTNIIKSIKEKYKDSHITVVCSPLNYDLVKRYRIVNQLYIHSKKNQNNDFFVKNTNVYYVYTVDR